MIFYPGYPRHVDTTVGNLKIESPGLEIRVQLTENRWIWLSGQGIVLDDNGDDNSGMMYIASNNLVRLVLNSGDKYDITNPLEAYNTHSITLMPSN